MRVFPIALIRADSGWKPAPLPASFENTGLGYTPCPPQPHRGPAGMDAARASHRSGPPARSIRAQSPRKHREKPAHGNPPRPRLGTNRRTLHPRLRPPQPAGNPRPARRSLDHHSRRLGPAPRRGGKSPRHRRRAAPVAACSFPTTCCAPSCITRRTGTARWFPSHAWTLPETHPAPPFRRSKFVHLELAKSADGFWRIDLPQAFLQDPPEADDFDDETPDQDLVDAFTSKLAETYPPSPRPDARQAAQDLADCLQNGALRDLLPLIAPSTDPEKPAKPSSAPPRSGGRCAIPPPPPVSSDWPPASRTAMPSRSASFSPPAIPIASICASSIS